MDKLNKHDWYVAECDLKDAQRMVAQWHYARGGSNTRVYTHGLFRKSDNALMGVAWWLPPTRVACESVSSDWKKVLSLTRLVCDPNCPPNAASFLIAASIKLIWKDNRFHSLVTYADEKQGHTGAIYRATNWTYVGRTGPYASWIDVDGKQVACKATVNRVKAEMLALGHTRQGSFYKHKFVMYKHKPTPTLAQENIMQFELKPTAVKKEQIDHINLLGRAVAALIDFATGDDEALTKFMAVASAAPTAPAATGDGPAPQTGAIAGAFAIDAAPVPISNLVQMPGPIKCACSIAVKDKYSATQLCLLCGGNAYENHYVFAHTDDGKNLLTHKEEAIDKLHFPVSEETPFPFIAMPDVFAPASEEDHGEETD